MSVIDIGTMGRLPAAVAVGSNLDEALWSHIVSGPSVAAIIGVRCFPAAVPDGQPLPAAVYQQISSQQDATFDGASGLAQTRYQISAWAETRSESKTLAEALRLRLQSFRGVLGDVTVQDIILSERRDVYEEALNNAQQRRHGVLLDFEIWYEEPIPTH